MSTRATVPVIRCNRCILQIVIICRSFISSNRFIVPDVGICQSRPIVNIFPSDPVKPKIFTCNQMQSLYSTDCDNLPILYFVEPVFFPNVRICQSRQIVNIFPSDSRKTKNLYLELYSNESKCKISFLCRTFAIPQI